MTRNRRMSNPSKKSGLKPPRLDRLEVIYGFHPVIAALCNPSRSIASLLLTTKAEAILRKHLSNPPFSNQRNKIDIVLERITTHGRTVQIDTITANLSKSAVHQGFLLKCRPLKPYNIKDSCCPATKTSLVLLLDQVTDPQNVGAILRSAEAFGATALIMQDRHSPPTTGALAKAASGALETVPLVRVSNLERAIKDLKTMGYWILGLDVSAEKQLSGFTTSLPTAIVLGSEGKGLRRLTRDRCDVLAKIELVHPKQSLNVSNAAAIALYQIASTIIGPT